MASSLIHLSAARRILDQVPIADPEQFRLGELLPDTASDTRNSPKILHYKKADPESGIRIFDLASTIAGGDPEKLKKMQDAVEEGFKQAGLTWKDATGQEDMPQITKDTHAEITKRFDDLYAKLTGKAADEGNA